MYKDLMPIGSVVLLEGGTKRIMICGRIVCKGSDTEIYDYVGCMYPDGVTDSSNMYFFNRDAIKEVFFIGFQDQEEFQYRNAINNLGELTVVDGKIVEKQ